MNWFLYFPYIYISIPVITLSVTGSNSSNGINKSLRLYEGPYKGSIYVEPYLNLETSQLRFFSPRYVEPYNTVFMYSMRFLSSTYDLLENLFNYPKNPRVNIFASFIRWQNYFCFFFPVNATAFRCKSETQASSDIAIDLSGALGTCRWLDSKPSSEIVRP